MDLTDGVDELRPHIFHLEHYILLDKRKIDLLLSDQNEHRLYNLRSDVKVLFSQSDGHPVRFVVHLHLHVL